MIGRAFESSGQRRLPFYCYQHCRTLLASMLGLARRTTASCTADRLPSSQVRVSPSSAAEEMLFC